jgi:hypothetical protein
VTSSSRVRERCSAAQDLSGERAPEGMAFAGAAALERGHDLDEVFEPYLRPASGVRASSSECSFERPGAEHRQRKGSYLASAGKRRSVTGADRSIRV